MKINITTDTGEVLEVIEAQDIGDLDKPLARTDLMTTIRDVWVRDAGGTFVDSAFFFEVTQS